MKTSKNLLFLLMGLFLSSHSTAQNSFFKPSRISLGSSIGLMRYFGDFQSTHPELIFFTPDVFDSPDFRNFQVFAEFENAKRISATVGLGYKEIWNGISVIVYPELNQGLSTYSNVGSYYLATMKIGYVFRIKKFEILPSFGGSFYFTDGLATYTNELFIGSDIKVGPLTTTQLRKSFFTLDGDLQMRYWLWRID